MFQLKAGPMKYDCAPVSKNLSEYVVESWNWPLIANFG